MTKDSFDSVRLPSRLNTGRQKVARLAIVSDLPAH